MPSVAVLRQSIVHALRSAGIPDPAREALLLCAHTLRRAPAWVLAHGDVPVAPTVAARSRRLAARRRARIPFAYLVGSAPFAGLTLRVTPAVLIPRPETETLVEQLIVVLPPPTRMLDVGTGSGAIACALARAWPHARVHASDASRAALRIARGNARALALPIRFHLADLVPRSPHCFDLVVANLPYLTHAELRRLQPEVAREPRIALDGGRDGAALVRRLLAALPSRLACGGTAVFEVHPATARALARTARHLFPGARINTTRDLRGREHFLWIRR